MIAKSQIEKIKNLIEERLDIVDVPGNGDQVLVIRETNIGRSNSIEIGIGKCWKYPGYWNCVGIIYNDAQRNFQSGNINVEKKLPKSTKVLVGKVKPEFLQAIEKASIGFSDDEWDGSLDNFIKLFEKYN